MGILSMFKKYRLTQTVQKWNELGGYQAVFSAFGADAYRSGLVRACVRPLASFSSKAYARCSKTAQDIERILNNRPNIYMNGREFIKKVRTMYEVNGTVCILISRDDFGRAIGFYPIPFSNVEALEYNKHLFVRFYFNSGNEPLVVAWEDLAVLRKDYNKYDVIGEDNRHIIDTLEMLHTLNQGLTNSIKSTANLRGLLKSTKAMLTPEDRKKAHDEFVKDYLNLENQGGIASLDATQEFIPINMSPMTANSEQMREIRNDVFRMFGVNDEIVTGKMTPEDIEVLYEMNIEPFLADLSDELTSKTFTPREIAHGAYILYEANKLQFASLSKKIEMFRNVVLYGGMTVNEWRRGCSMPPVEGGDDLIMRLDAQKIEDQKHAKEEESYDDEQ